MPTSSRASRRPPGHISQRSLHGQQMGRTSKRSCPMRFCSTTTAELLVAALQTPTFRPISRASSWMRFTCGRAGTFPLAAGRPGRVRLQQDSRTWRMGAACSSRAWSQTQGTKHQLPAMGPGLWFVPETHQHDQHCMLTGQGQGEQHTDEFLVLGRLPSLQVIHQGRLLFLSLGDVGDQGGSWVPSFSCT